LKRITRKNLKSDKFAEEVTTIWDWTAEHKTEVVRYGSIALAVVLIAAGIFYYLRYQANQREDALAAALRETVALCRIADQLLALARLDHEAAVERRPLDLSALMREVLDTVEPLLQAKHLDLRTSVADDVVVSGNPDHLRRLIVNLLDNALKFTSEHGTIAVNLATNGGGSTMRIANAGPGIPAADLPRIFDRFFRGKAQSQPGSGLGLSLCQEIARLHGGEIKAANLATGGVEFALSLPAAGPRPAEPSRRPAESHTGS